MSIATKEPEIKTRKIGERVKVAAYIEAGKTKDMGNGLLEAVISTGSTDRHNEKIIIDGVDLRSFKKSPVVLYGHDYESLPIGKAITIKKADNKIISKFQLAVDEYPFAATIHGLIKGGYLNDVSIGGIVKKWSEDYSTIQEMEMVEFSVVNIGANRDAKITSRAFKDITGKSVDDVRDEYQEFVHKTLLDKVASMGNDEVSDAISVLKNLLARLEESVVENPPHTDEYHTRKVKHIVMRDARAVATQAHKVLRTVKLKKDME